MMRNVLMLSIIALVIPMLFFAGNGRTEFGNFVVIDHVNTQLTYNTNDAYVAAHSSMNTNRFYFSVGANAKRANMNSMFTGLSFNVPLKTLPNGPIRYYDVNVPLRNMDGYW